MSQNPGGDQVATTPGPSIRRLALLLGTLVALTVVSSSAIAVALPDVRRDLGLDGPGTAWVVAAYSLAFSITTAIFGRLADLQGLRRPMRIGIVLFALGSLLGATADSFTVLIGGRVLQGAGAGAVPVIGFGIIGARFAGEARGKALGALTAVVSVVSGSGPLIGGGIAHLFGWRWVLALPAIAVLFAEPVVRLAPDRPTAQGKVDVRGALILVVAVTGLAMVLQSPSTGLDARTTAVLAAVSVAGFVLLAAHVRARPLGLLPARILRDQVVMRSGLVGLTLLAAYLGAMLAVPQALHRELGWEPLRIGLLLLVPAGIGALSSRVVGGVAARLGRARVAAALALGSAAGLLAVAAFHRQPVPLLGGMALVFMGFGGGQVALLDGLSDAVDESVRGVALGIFNLIFFLGGAVGSATVGGLSEVLPVSGALAVLALLPAAGSLLALTLWRAERARA